MLLISVILASVTATFNEKFGVPASTWEALFMIAIFGSGIWFLTSIVYMIINWTKSSTKFLIAQIKASDEN